MKKQTVKRVYPPAYTGDTLSELREMLEEGWRVVLVTLVREDKSGGRVHDYILEKEST